jgi:hypothetical protein
MGKVHAIDQEDGISVSEVIPTPAFGDAGVKGWTIQAPVDAGTEFYIFQADPNSTMAAHNSSDEWRGHDGLQS